MGKIGAEAACERCFCASARVCVSSMRSILLSPIRRGVLGASCCTRAISCVWGRGYVASTSHNTISGFSSACRISPRIYFCSAVLASSHPGVSTKMSCAVVVVRIPVICCLVVCALGVTTEILAPTIWFMSVDFPTLGFPTMLINPARYFCSDMHIKISSFLFWLSFPLYLLLLRGRAVVARRAHNPKVTGSNPVPAT